MWFFKLTLKVPNSRQHNLCLQNSKTVGSILRIQHYRAKSVDTDEVAHDEPPHLYLLCLQILTIFVFGAARVLK